MKKTNLAQIRGRNTIYTSFVGYAEAYRTLALPLLRY